MKAIFSAENLIYIGMEILSLYIYKCFFDGFFLKSKKISTVFKMIIYFIFLVISYSSFVFLNSRILNVIITMGFFLILVQFYESTIQYKLLAIFIFTITMISIEVFIILFYSIITKIKIDNIWINKDSVISLIVISRIIPLILVKIYQYFRKKRIVNENKKIKINKYLRLFIIPIFSILIINFLHILLDKENLKSYWIVIISTIFILIINLLFYYLYSELIKKLEIEKDNILLKQQIYYYSSQYLEIENRWNYLKILRHDLKHNLINIYSNFVDSECIDMEKLKFEFNKLIEDINVCNAKIYSGNIAIDSILNYEINLAKSKNISVNINISVNKEINIDGKKLCIILGNAIDNAIEACEKLNTKNKEILINIFEEKNNLYISIANPYIGEIKFKDKLPITIKKDKDIHGIGLRSIQKTIDKNGYMQITNEKNIFLLEIVLFNIKNNKK